MGPETGGKNLPLANLDLLGKFENVGELSLCPLIWRGMPSSFLQAQSRPEPEAAISHPDQFLLHLLPCVSALAVLDLLVWVGTLTLA